MPPKYLFLAVVVITPLLYSCSRKHHPERTTPASSEKNNTVIIPTKSDSVVSKKTVYRPKQKDIIPKVIVVNDAAAHKSVDGRFYYDLIGHRYWKNNKDGKYYLFNKSMYNNDAFKAPRK